MKNKISVDSSADGKIGRVYSGSFVDVYSTTSINGHILKSDPKRNPTSTLITTSLNLLNKY